LAAPRNVDPVYDRSGSGKDLGALFRLGPLSHYVRFTSVSRH